MFALSSDVIRDVIAYLGNASIKSTMSRA